MASGILSRINTFYAAKFETHPVSTLVVANGGLTTIADVFMDGTSTPYDYERTARFAAFGMAMGPPVGAWLKFLDRTFPFKGGSAVGQTVKRVLADQVVFAPLGLAMFTGSMGVMEGKTQDELKDKFDGVYWQALMTNWKVWPVIQAVNFSLVPLPYRLPFQQTCGIAWSTYLSMLNAKQNDKEAAEKRP